MDSNEIVNIIRSKIRKTPTTGIVLGSGLRIIANDLEKIVKFPYKDIQGLPKASVEGHAGELLLADFNSEKIVIANGRFHFYEGLDLDTIILPIKIFQALGVKNLILTNSAGSVRQDNFPGTFMVSVAHIDCTYKNSAEIPILSKSEDFHSPKLLNISLEAAKHLKIKLIKGIYAWTLGPSYETPAEIDFIKTLGADAVGMSTVPEIRAASNLGMNILTISCLTNYAAGVSRQPILHKDVIAVSSEHSDKLSVLLREIILRIKDLNEC